MLIRLRSFLRRRRMLRVPTRSPLDRFMFVASYISGSAVTHLRSNLATYLSHISTATENQPYRNPKGDKIVLKNDLNLREYRLHRAKELRI